MSDHTTITATATTATRQSPLWPIPIPIIGLTGEKWSGKTLFALSIDPKHSLIYDTEKSSLSYQAGLGFDRVDVMAEMLAKYPNGHKPVDRFTWWLDNVRKIQPGKYSVIVCDTVNEIETGLADWVDAHPEFFGHTRAQYQKMSGLKWQDVKDLWLSIIASDLASRCETFAFVTHMGDEWAAGGGRTGKRKPKGKDTLFQLASLFLQMERPKDRAGNVQQVPSAIVLKDRLAAFHTDPTTGEIKILPVMPPRLPKATPHAIRGYMLNPPDFSKLTDEERAPEVQITDDDRAEVRMRTAEAEARAEEARLARVGGASAYSQEVQPRPVSRCVPLSTSANGASPHVAPTATANVPVADDAGPTDDQLQTIAELRQTMFAMQGIDLEGHEDEQDAKWREFIGADSVRSLTREECDELITVLKERYDPFDGGKLANSTS